MNKTIIIILLISVVIFGGKAQPNAFPEAVFLQNIFSPRFFIFHPTIQYDLLLIPESAKKITLYYNCKKPNLATDIDCTDSSKAVIFCVSVELKKDGTMRKVLYEDVHLGGYPAYGQASLAYKGNSYCTDEVTAHILKRDTLGFFVWEDSVWQFHFLRFSAEDSNKTGDWAYPHIIHDYRTENKGYPIYNIDTILNRVTTCYIKPITEKKAIENWHHELFHFLCYHENRKFEPKQGYDTKTLSCNREASISPIKFGYKTILTDSLNRPKAIYQTGFWEGLYCTVSSTSTIDQQNLLSINGQHFDNLFFLKKPRPISIHFEIQEIDQQQNWLLRKKVYAESYDIRTIEYW